jgi:hypothetical protein
MSTLRVCLLLITASATAWGGWRHDCRVANRECRQNQGAPTTTTTTTLEVTTFTNGEGSCSVNCIHYQGHTWCLADNPPFDTARCAPPPQLPHHPLFSDNCSGHPVDCVSVGDLNYCLDPDARLYCALPSFCPQ